MVLGARSGEEIAGRSGIGSKRAWQCLARLEKAGAVSRVDDDWQLEVVVLRDAALAALPARTYDDHGAADPGAAAVLRAFFKDGRLTSIPVVQSKRLVVLDHIALVFEPGRRYAETEVNAALLAFHPDTAALRRYLVDAGMLSRADGCYWRSGGAVLLD